MDTSHKMLLLNRNGLRYDQIIAALFGANLIQYLPANETTGTTAEDATANNRDGTYSNVTLNSIAGPVASMGYAGLWNASTSYLDVYSASLAGAFSASAGTLSFWFRMLNSTAWTGAVGFKYMARLAVNGTNQVRIWKTNVNNTFTLAYIAGGTTKEVSTTSSSLGWIHACITWSVAADEVKTYINGIQIGATQTGLGTWAGSLAASTCNLGSAVNTGSNVHSGYIFHYALANRAATPAEVAILANSF